MTREYPERRSVSGGDFRLCPRGALTVLRVAVLGARGRMGAVTCAAVEADAELELVARVGSSDSLEAVPDAGADVAVDFTVPGSVKRNTAWLLERGVHVVVGATGMSGADLEELEKLTGPANCLVAPNFAIGAVLLMRLAEQAVRHLPDAEIIELHHERKVDAPSGTALRTAQLLSDARGHGDVPIHSVRLPGLVAHQEVIFGAQGQTLTLRHDTTDRTAFMPGVLLAVKRVADLPGLTVGLDVLLSER